MCAPTKQNAGFWQKSSKSHQVLHILLYGQAQLLFFPIGEAPFLDFISSITALMKASSTLDFIRSYIVSSVDLIRSITINDIFLAVPGSSALIASGANRPTSNSFELIERPFSAMAFVLDWLYTVAHCVLETSSVSNSEAKASFEALLISTSKSDPKLSMRVLRRTSMTPFNASIVASFIPAWKNSGMCANTSFERRAGPEHFA